MPLVENAGEEADPEDEVVLSRVQAVRKKRTRTQATATLLKVPALKGMENVMMAQTLKIVRLMGV